MLVLVQNIRFERVQYRIRASVNKRANGRALRAAFAILRGPASLLAFDRSIHHHHFGVIWVMPDGFGSLTYIVRRLDARNDISLLIAAVHAIRPNSINSTMPCYSSGAEKPIRCMHVRHGYRKGFVASHLAFLSNDPSFILTEALPP